MSCQTIVTCQSYIWILRGYELAAIDGAMQTIRRCRPILIIEVFFNDEEWLLTKLKPLGYRRATNFGANCVVTEFLHEWRSAPALE